MSHATDIAAAARLDRALAEHDEYEATRLDRALVEHDAPPPRRRITVPEALYHQIASDAAAIGLTAQAHAVSLLTRALQRSK